MIVPWCIAKAPMGRSGAGKSATVVPRGPPVWRPRRRPEAAPAPIVRRGRRKSDETTERVGYPYRRHVRQIIDVRNATSWVEDSRRWEPGRVAARISSGRPIGARRPCDCLCCRRHFTYLNSIVPLTNSWCVFSRFSNTIVPVASARSSTELCAFLLFANCALSKPGTSVSPETPT